MQRVDAVDQDEGRGRTLLRRLPASMRREVVARALDRLTGRELLERLDDELVLDRVRTAEF